MAKTTTLELNLSELKLLEKLLAHELHAKMFSADADTTWDTFKVVAMKLNELRTERK